MGAGAAVSWLLLKVEGKQLLRAHPVANLLYQRSPQKLLAACRNPLGQDTLYLEILYFSNKFLLGLGSPGHSAGQHLVEADPDGPNVTLEPVTVASESLEGHK